MMTLIRGGSVYAPEPLGPKDILLAAGSSRPSRRRGASGWTAAGRDRRCRGQGHRPRLIDPHVHILGGGGEGGPTTRAPEIRVEDIVASGVTTVIAAWARTGSPAT